ncbi:hypothetical protein IY230_01010 [Acholeplasma laidlawii]|nr:hypothetical protein [Acholeplasma laidlawii]
MKTMIKKYPKTKFIAHRGLPSKVLENTLEGFKKASKLPFFGIETDIHLTLDQVAIIHHDHNLLRLANIDLNINETTYEVIKALKLKDTYKIPLLDTYIDICKTFQKEAIIELKAEFTLDQIKFIIEKIDTHDYLDHVIFISFHRENLLQLRSILKNCLVQLLTDKFDDEIFDFLIKNRFDLSIHHSQVTKDLINLLHKYNIKISTWTVNDKVLMENLAKLGIDYITTDGI